VRREFGHRHERRRHGGHAGAIHLRKRELSHLAAPRSLTRLGPSMPAPSADHSGFIRTATVNAGANNDAIRCAGSRESYGSWRPAPAGSYVRGACATTVARSNRPSNSRSLLNRSMPSAFARAPTSSAQSSRRKSGDGHPLLPCPRRSGATTRNRSRSVANEPPS
jgi:hypothetical protein